MKHLNLAPAQHIELTQKDGSTTTQALNEAIELAKAWPDCTFDLTANGFLFCVESTSDLKEEIGEYNEWIAAQESVLQQTTENDLPF